MQTKSAGKTFRTAYGPKLKVPLKFPAHEGRTKQSFKDECDINTIMRRYQQTGTLEHVQRREAQYADCTGRDYQTAMELIANARSAFEELPAAVRDRFDNDPAELLDFVRDPDNAEEAAELGLLSPEGVAALVEKTKAAQAAAASAPAEGAAGGSVTSSEAPPAGAGQREGADAGSGKPVAASAPQSPVRRR